MMKKKRLPHVLATVTLILFIGLGLASDGTTSPGQLQPRDSCPQGIRCYFNNNTSRYTWCQARGRCIVGEGREGGPSLRCNC